MRVKKLPMILALHLKRFKYMEQLQRYTKLSYRVVFPLELRLFNTSGDATNPERLYDLVAVVVHCGRCVGASTQPEPARDAPTYYCSHTKTHWEPIDTSIHSNMHSNQIFCPAPVLSQWELSSLFIQHVGVLSTQCTDSRTWMNISRQVFLNGQTYLVWSVWVRM